MCGILAQIVPERRPAQAVEAASRRFGDALRCMRSRGPDGEGVWSCPTTGLATLGHRRLAIVDRTSAGHQPMVTPDGLVAITYNGEIYNAGSLRRELESVGVRFLSRTDTEVVLHGYAKWGPQELLRRLQGMFAFAIWDARSVEHGGRLVLLAAVDHAGMKPLYWHLSRGVLSIASTADALREAVDERPELDPLGLCHVLSLGYCPAPATVWRGVFKLGPAQFFEWSPGEGAPEVRSWWQHPEVIIEKDRTCTTPGESCAARASQFEQLITSVTREHLVSDVPLSLLLSGGIDSTVLACALAANDQHVPCVTLGLCGDDDESQAAAATAAHLGLEHQASFLESGSIPDLMRSVARSFDEPQGFGALLTMTEVARVARRRGTVVLAGDGGDEAFGGYAWHRPTARTSKQNIDASCDVSMTVARPGATSAERAAALSALASRSFVHNHLQNVMPRFHPAEAAALLAPLGAEYDEEIYASWLSVHDRDSLPSVRRRQRLDLFGFCPGSILPKLDRATMACGVELRAPFLDRRVLEWSLALPERGPEGSPGACEALAGQQSKAVLREYLRGRVPPAVLARPKQGFSLRVPMSDVIGSMLKAVNSSKLVSQGVLRADWESYVRTDAPNAQGRAFVVCALAAWWEERA